jgi:transcriptional regulator with XRE-family HTH domain
VAHVLNVQSLRELRKRAGLTQAEVASRVGIPVTVLSAYECGRRQPSLYVAGRIIDAIGFDVRFAPRPDAAVQSRRLVEVLTLAEALPYRPRPLAKARRWQSGNAVAPVITGSGPVGGSGTYDHAR